MEYSVSFIIPSYNSYRTISRSLESILKQKNEGSIKEIIIVDSSDDNETAQLLETFTHKKISKLLLTKKTIPAKARNIGAERATGDILCFIDSDVYLAQDWLEKMLAAYSLGCKIAGGSIGLPEFQEYEPVAKAQLYLQFNEYLDTASPGARRLIPSCNMMCERRLFTQVQGFPELRASEDTVFCLKLGGIEKICFLPEARARHIFRIERKSFLKNQELLGKYVAVYRRLNYNKWIYQGIFPVVLFPAFLAVKILRIFFRIAKAGKGHRRQLLASLGEFSLGLAYWSIGFIKGCFSDENSERSI